jgi:hypothetical protein
LKTVKEGHIQRRRNGAMQMMQISLLTKLFPRIYATQTLEPVYQQTYTKMFTVSLSILAKKLENNPNVF